MKRIYELLLFDFDGTLVDTVGDIAFHANAVLRRNGFRQRSVTAVRKAVGWGVHELLKTLEPAFGLRPERLERAVADFKRRYQKKPVLRTRPFPHVRRCLESLKETPKAIITNKPQDIALSILNKLGMRSYFEAVVGMHTGFPPKPDPTGLLSVIRAHGCPRSRAIYIGDSRVDAETCAAAGVDFGWVSWGYDRLKGEKARHRFKDAREWKKLVKPFSGTPRRTG